LPVKTGTMRAVYPLEAEAWTDFAVAVASASAALGGLLFVAVSINLQRILSLPRIPARAALSLILLATPVFFGVVLLIPGQPRWALGVELIVIAAVIGPLLARLADPLHRISEQPRWSWLVSNILPALILSLGALLAGVSLVADLPALGGLYWIPAGTVLGLVGGLSNAWVLLVEILR
jgi:hypothetical protein